MGKNIAVKIGDQLQNFQDVNITRFKTVGGESAEFIDIDEVGGPYIYTVPYYSPSTITEAQKEEIKEIITAIASEKADYALFMKISTGIIPASYIADSRNKTVRATLHDENNRSYQVVLSKAGEVTVSQETIYVMEPEKIESATSKAPTGAAMASYVQDYVAEHGGGTGGGSDGDGAETVFELTTTEELTRIDTGFTPTAADGIVMVHFMIPATGASATKNFWISLSDSPNSTNYISWLSMYGNKACAVTQIIVPVSKEKLISVIADASTASAKANFQRTGTEKPYNLTLKIGSADSTVPFPIGTKITVVKYGGGYSSGNGGTSGGGEVWELAKTITLTDPTTVVLEELGGNYRKLHIEFDGLRTTEEAPSSPKQCWMNINSSAHNNAKAFALYPTNSPSGGVVFGQNWNCYGVIDITGHNDFVECSYTLMWGANNAAHNIFIKDITAMGETFNSIRLHLGGGGEFATTLEMKVWGVKA